MSFHTDFRIDFQSYGGCSGESRVDTEAIERLAGMPRFGTGRIVRWLVYAVPAIYLVLFALWLTGMVAGNVIVAVFILLLVLSGLFAKRVTRIQEQLNRTLQSLSRVCSRWWSGRDSGASHCVSYKADVSTATALSRRGCPVYGICSAISTNATIS